MQESTKRILSFFIIMLSFVACEKEEATINIADTTCQYSSANPSLGSICLSIDKQYLSDKSITISLHTMQDYFINNAKQFRNDYLLRKLEFDRYKIKVQVFSKDSDILLLDREFVQDISAYEPDAKLTISTHPLASGIVSLLDTMGKEVILIREMVLTPDNQKMIIRPPFGAIEIYNRQNGELLSTFTHQYPEELFAGNDVVMIATGATVTAYDIHTQEQLYTFTEERPIGSNGHPTGSNGRTPATFSKDSTFFARSSRNNTSGSVRDTRTGKVILNFSHDNYHAISTPSLISNNNTLVIAGYQNSEVIIYNLKDQSRIFLYTNHANLRYIFLSADEQELFTVGSDGEIKTWDMQTLKKTQTTQTNLHWTRIEATPDGRYLIGSKGQMIDVWDMQTQSLAHTMHAPAHFLINKDGKSLTTIASTKDESRVNLRDIETGAWLTVDQNKPSYWTNEIHLSSDEQFLYFSGVYDLQLHKLNLATEAIDRSLLVSTTKSVVKFQELSEGRFVGMNFAGACFIGDFNTATFEEFLECGAWNLEIMPDKQSIIFAILSNVEQLNFQTKKFTKLIDTDFDIHELLLVSEDTLLLAVQEPSDSYRTMHTLKLWDINKGELIDTFPGVHQAILTMFLSDNKQYLITVHRTTLTIWDYQKKQIIHSLTDLAGSYPVKILGDNATAMVIASTGELYIVDLQTGSLIQIINSPSHKTFSATVAEKNGLFYTAAGGIIKVWGNAHSQPTNPSTSSGAKKLFEWGVSQKQTANYTQLTP